MATYTHTFSIDINGDPIKGKINLGGDNEILLTQTPEMSLDHLAKVNSILQLILALSKTCTVQKIEVKEIPA